MNDSVIQKLISTIHPCEKFSRQSCTIWKWFWLHEKFCVAKSILHSS